MLAQPTPFKESFASVFVYIACVLVATVFLIFIGAFDAVRLISPVDHTSYWNSALTAGHLIYRLKRKVGQVGY